jgi:hypothetical protein
LSSEASILGISAQARTAGSSSSATGISGQLTSSIMEVTGSPAAELSRMTR